MTPSVKHRVQLFASWSDTLGPEVEVELPAGARVADLLETLETQAKSKSITPLPRPSVALNQRYAKPDAVLAAGDEIAIIPPVAGG
ncbi:MoaD/ThiS family protein [Pseudogemmatithrix spongiicola]|uniref:Molybdopterin synthase sulfur carrier subunit n=1 Tax=Pseudogemmatithrix spongiicola TaxID=3062599 RepID=A0AA49Q8I8_9BACT|nr:MoaD/ThiS family protein [Gemmatimonadaceae bacterium 'strain 138']WKW15150.1 MoaD/ThiS family protein [Gemmatimonadaceae bacterium 'strain 318']